MDKLRQQVKSRIKELKTSQSEVCRQSGVSTSQLSRWLKGDNMNADALTAVLEALGGRVTWNIPLWQQRSNILNALREMEKKMPESGGIKRHIAEFEKLEKQRINRNRELRHVQ